MEFHSTNPNSPPAAPRLRVAQVVDSLAAGGAERFAVNLANTLADNGHESYLCSTRAEGPLAAIVKPGVGRLRLNRSRSLDPLAFIAFARYLTRHRIQILHAHSSAVFISLIGAVSSSAAPRIVWHLHQGKLAQNSSPPLLMRLASRRVAAVIAVSRPLADWAIEKLQMSPQRVSYIANYVRMPRLSQTDAQLPGTSGFRIVCVANLRPEKDTLNLLAAMTQVLRQVPQAHLLLVGGCGDQAYGDRVRAEVMTRQMTQAVTFVGPRDDVPHLLQSCDVAVISSAAEGFPLAILEYGAAGLATVSTRVGACAEILENGRVGLVVPPSEPAALAAAIVTLLRSRDLRERLGAAFKSRVEREYGEQRIVTEITEVYRRALSA
jgi:glycosyltransferase involved in cell wall biosynthesis